MDFKVLGTPSGISSLDWSEHNKIAVCTASNTIIVSIELDQCSKTDLPLLPEPQVVENSVLNFTSMHKECVKLAVWSPYHFGCVLLAVTNHGRAFIYRQCDEVYKISWEIVSV